MIGFDNSIEVSITTFLSLDPLQRKGQSYKGVDVEKWLENYHTKIDFFFSEIVYGKTVECDKATVVWYHNVRNGQYHSGGATDP